MQAPRNLVRELHSDSDRFILTHSAVYKSSSQQTPAYIVLLSQQEFWNHVFRVVVGFYPHQLQEQQQLEGLWT
jgi:hypothetical protein